jgi:putative transposase
VAQTSVCDTTFVIPKLPVMSQPTKNFYHRNLPHWHPSGRSIFVTWRLYGSLPANVINELKIRRQHLKKIQEAGSVDSNTRIREYKKLFARVDAILDKATTGPLWLKETRIADLVQQALLKQYAHLYTLWAYAVMANHLHALLRPKKVETSLATITKHLKGYTAREANRLLDRTGQRFWQDESFDHWPRDRKEFSRIVAYIENNPVKAGLVKRPEEWTWSSAAERKRRGWQDFRPLT